MNEFLCEWQTTTRDQRLHEFATRYHVECETYDRTVCTGPIRDGFILPATPREMTQINRNAMAVRKRVEEDAVREGFTLEELSRAIGKWDEPMPG